MSLFRRQRPPEQLAALLEPDERALAWAPDETGAMLMASTLGLWLPGPDGPTRLGWADITTAGWRDGVLRLVRGVEVEDGYVESQRPELWSIPEPGGLPPAIRERVTHSVSVTEHFPLRPTGGVRIVGRKVPGEDGLRWRAHLDGDASRHDPQVRDQVSELIARVSAVAVTRTF